MSTFDSYEYQRLLTDSPRARLYHNELFFRLGLPFSKTANGTKSWREALQEVAAQFPSRFIEFVPELQTGGGGGTGLWRPNINEGLY